MLKNTECCDKHIIRWLNHYPQWRVWPLLRGSTLSSQSRNPSVLTQHREVSCQFKTTLKSVWTRRNIVLAKTRFWPNFRFGRKCAPAKNVCRPKLLAGQIFLFRKSVLAKWRYVVMNDSCSGAYLPDDEAIQTFGLHLSSCLRPCFHDSVEQLHMNEVVSYRLSTHSLTWYVSQ